MKLCLDTSMVTPRTLLPACRFPRALQPRDRHSTLTAEARDLVHWRKHLEHESMQVRLSALRASSAAIWSTGCWPSETSSSCWDSFSTGQAPVPQRRALRHPNFRARRGRHCPICRRPMSQSRWHELRSSVWPLMQTSVSERTIRGARPGTEHDRYRRMSWKPCAANSVTGGSPSPRRGSIYGEPAVFPTPETCPMFPSRRSLYGVEAGGLKG